MARAWMTTTAGAASAATLDTFGFPLAVLTEADHATRQRALAKERKVASEWTKGLPVWQPDFSNPSPAPRKLRLLARKGIPQELRPELWLQFSGGLALRSISHEGHYQVLLEAAPKLQKNGLVHLYSAISKSFPGLKLLCTVGGQEATRRLVTAYSQHTSKSSLLGDPALLSLAAFLLAVLGMQHEETAFWTLVGLVENRLSSLALLQGESYSGLEARVLANLSAKKCPRLTSLLDLLDMPFSSLLRNWLPTLFTQCLPAETVARIWDVLMVEESPACFRIGVAMIKMNENALVTTCRSGLVDRSLSWRVAHTFDADALLKTAFGTVLPLVSLDEIAAARANAQRTYEAELAARQARLGTLFRVPSYPPLDSQELRKSKRQPLAALSTDASPVNEIQRFAKASSAEKVEVVIDRGMPSGSSPPKGDILRAEDRPKNYNERSGVTKSEKGVGRQGSARNSSSGQQVAAMFF